MIPSTFTMTNSTELVKKHKNEYMKAGKKELAFGKAIRGMRADKPLFDERNGASVSKELQEEALVLAPVLMKKRQELAQHQQANRRNAEYQVIKSGKKAQRKVRRIAKKKAVGQR